ncbi:MAG: serine/threonine-protein kinase, partial [Pyrinomonadaceae bacterium]
GLYQCSACRHKAARVTRTELLRRNSKMCAKCGKDVSGEMGEHRQGEFLCAACKTDTSYLVRFLLELADKGDKNVLAIQGYEIIRELGKGGMGAVYLARQIKTGSQVALKVMLPEVAADEYAKESFWREAENTRALKHRHTVELRDWGISNGIFFFTLEYCEGGSVSDLIKRRGGKLSIDEAGRIIIQALDGLEYAHHAPIPYVKRVDGSFGPGRGLVHRDIKPANIFLSGLGSSYIAKVGDYGLAKAFDVAGLSGRTGTNAKAGTLQFMPRQQAVSFKYAKPEVDVWAMAATFYMMLTGRCPRNFPKREDPQGMDVWQVVLQTKPVPIRNRDASIPKRLADVIDLALVDQPAIHFKTSAEFKQALESVL